MAAKPTFFSTPSAWRAWLKANHAQVKELWVGFYKKDSGRPSITWPESVDGALCFGWIDGRRQGIDGISYKIRFTPRKPGSSWSAININRAQELVQLGLMQPAGSKAFQARTQEKSETYSYEQRNETKLSAAYQRQFRAQGKAWTFFREQAPWYQRTATWWVMSAKGEDTRLRRLATLIENSGSARLVPPLRRPGSK